MSEEIIDINEIMNLIPHRYPFLLIDKVIKIESNTMIVGIKNVTINEPHFTGHFPLKPIMPGVLIIEAMAQLAAILVAKTMDITENKEVLFMSIEHAKFRRVVKPGDRLVITANYSQNRGSVWKFTGKAEVDDQIAAEANFTAMVKDKAEKD